MFRKRQYRKKKAAPRRRQYGARKVRRVPSVHRFKEMTKLNSWSASASSIGTGIQSYKLGDLTNLSNIVGMFDMYKITGVKLSIVPRYDTASVTDAMAGIGGAQGSLPVLYIAPNRSPWSTAPASVLDILNDDGCKIVRLDKPRSFYLSSPGPRILDGAGNGVPVQTSTNTQLWLTTGGGNQAVDQSGVEYFGHKYVISNDCTFGVFVDVYATYYFTCKEQN